jgi:Na+/phosphate symporter
METFATIFAGLGLFIIGLNGLTKAMRSINSRGLHKLVQSSTAHPVLSALVGMLTSVITQVPRP